MKITHIALTTLISFVLINTTKAQKKFEYKSSRSLFEEAEKYSEDKYYDKAYETYMMVNYNDTSYFSSRFNAIYSANMNDKYDTVIALANLLIADTRPNEFKEAYSNSLVVAYNGKKEYEKAIEHADRALVKFPNSYLLHYNKALALIELNKIDLGVASLQQSLTFNPRFSAGHAKLGKICADGGNFTKAALCYNMAIYNAAGKDVSALYIAALSEIYDGNITGDKYKIKYREDEDFEDVDVLILNKVARNPKYKVKVELQDNIFKTNHLVFNSLEYTTGSNGFWNQNYIRFFKEIMLKNQFANFCYLEVLGLNDAKIQSVITKNKKKLIEFIEWAGSFSGTCFNERKIWNGKDYVDNTFNHYGSYGYNEIRTIKDNKVIGIVQTVSNRGLIRSEGYMNEVLQYDGVWKFYDDAGRIKTSATYKNNKLEGERITYYENGSKNTVMDVKNDRSVGKEKQFYNFNQVYSTRTYDNNGIENGPAVYYHEIGTVSHKFNVVNEKINGQFEEFYPNGKLKIKKTFVNGLAEGEQIGYFENGEIWKKGNFVKGNPNGEWFFYHENGKLESSGIFKDGSRIGVWKVYRENGNISDETDYGDTGKKTGIYKSYDVDGKLEFELTYKGEDLIAYKTYDSKGNVTNDVTKKKNTLDIEFYHENGVVRTKGSYLKTNKTGTWEYFNSYAVLTSSVAYNSEGLIDGKVLSYHDNGKIKSIEEYKNDMMDGYVENFYENGQLSSHGWYSEDEPVGPWIYYYRDGTKKTEQYFLENEIHGEVKYYNNLGLLDEVSYYYNGTFEGAAQYDTLGNIIGKSMLKDGAGTIKYYYQNKSLNGASDYLGANLHGKVEWYYSDGKIISKGERHNDEKVGTWTYYHRNGKVSSSGKYVDGLEEGEWIWYYENGEIDVKKTFRFGNTEGIRYSYYDNGKIQSEINHFNDERHGKATYYDPNGEIQLERYYVNGILTGYSYLGKDKKMLPMIPFDIKIGKMEAYFWNGQKSYEANLPNGIYQGATTYYSLNGQPVKSYIYEDDMENGLSKEYHTNGKIKSEINVSDDQNHGLTTVYYPSGKVKSKENYILGELYGWAYYYDETGKLTHSIYYYDDEAITKK
jgi:antitoxin component YwqK of YwqJK toxin-antitoxin module